jgi:hypothetical protein
MPTFASYHEETGRLDSKVHLEKHVVEVHRKALQEEGWNIISHSGPVEANHKYVADGAVVDRPTASIDKINLVADGVDAATLSNLPEPCTVRINGHVYEVTGGELVITASTPADYHIQIKDDDAFPLQAFEATVEAS